MAKHADSKGRITLGKLIANRTFFVEEQADAIVLRFARVVPEREAWLWNNPEALRSVQEGVAAARRGELVDGPDLDEASRIADQCSDS